MWFPWLSTQRCQDMIWEKMNSIFMWATPSSEDYFKSGQPTLLFKLPWPKCRACSLSLPTVPLHGYAGSLNEHELNQVTWASAQEASLWISIPSLFSPLACVCPPVCDWHGFILLPRTALAPQFTSDACLPVRKDEHLSLRVTAAGLSGDTSPQSPVKTLTIPSCGDDELVMADWPRCHSTHASSSALEPQMKRAYCRTAHGP